MDVFSFPRGQEKILRKFHFIPPKFHFILPKFHFASTWRVFIFHVDVSDFLRRNWLKRKICEIAVEWVKCADLKADALDTMSSSTSLYSSFVAHLSLPSERLWCVSLDWGKLVPGRYNNLDPTTYRYGAVSGKSDFHVEISKSPRGEFLFPR